MIVIIDYAGGNIGSLSNAVRNLGFSCHISNQSSEILAADGVIFPGQGRAGTAMQALVDKNLINTLKQVQAPFLGICLGMQLLTDYSAEDNTSGLEIISGNCKRFPHHLRTPHIGWNQVDWLTNCPLQHGIDNHAYFYFVHSYFVKCCQEHTVATTDYDFAFTSVVQYQNFYACQFHPEKSATNGQKLLRNFLQLC